MIYNHAKAEAKFRKEWEKKVRFYNEGGSGANLGGMRFP